MKTLSFFVLPGFKEQASYPWYKPIREHFKGFAGVKVYAPAVHWNYRVMSDYVGEFEKYFNKHKSERNIIFGFSFGAIIAFLAAPRLQDVEQLLLCSLSPYFQEDTKKMDKQWIKSIGKRRFNNFKTLSASAVGQNIQTKTTIFYGEKEGKKWPTIRKRCEQAHRDIKNSQLIVVPDALHDISHPEYMHAIEKELNKINI